MNAFAPKILLGALVAVAPLSAAQQFNERVTARPDVTLLTGPHLLSPAERPLKVNTISSEQVAPAVRPSATSGPEAAQEKRAGAQLKLEELKTDFSRPGLPGLDALPDGLRAVPARFETRLPATSTALPKKPQPPASRQSAGEK